MRNLWVGSPILGRLGCSGFYFSAVDGSYRFFPGWGGVSGAVGESFGIESSVVMGGISRVVFVMCMVG